MALNSYSVRFDPPGGVTVVVAGSTISKENFRTGEVVLRCGLSGGTAAGTISLRGHCYEQGNAVAEQTAAFSEQIPGGTDDEVAAALAGRIEPYECCRGSSELAERYRVARAFGSLSWTNPCG